MTEPVAKFITKIVLREEQSYDKAVINQIVDIHIEAFKGFFLTFLGKGFLKQLYQGFSNHEASGLIVAEYEGSVVGFIAYSENLKDFYKFLIKKRLISFAFYSLGAVIRKPSAMMRLVRAFLKPAESARDEAYIELSSIGVLPSMNGKRVGSRLIQELQQKYKGSRFPYIKLETDAIDNDYVNSFYLKNGFVLDHEYTTHEGRKMYEYRCST